MTKKRLTLLALPVLALTLAACGGTDETVLTSGSTTAGGITVSPSTTSSATATTTATATASPSAGLDDDHVAVDRDRTVKDARADLDLDDQSGDGRSVKVDEVRLSSGSGHVAIIGPGGVLLGSVPVNRTSKPVTITLTTPITASATYMGVLYGDDGDGVLDVSVDPVVLDPSDDDDPDEVVAEDFDYRVR